MKKHDTEWGVKVSVLTNLLAKPPCKSYKRSELAYIFFSWCLSSLSKRINLSLMRRRWAGRIFLQWQTHRKTHNWQLKTQKAELQTHEMSNETHCTTISRANISCNFHHARGPKKNTNKQLRAIPSVRTARQRLNIDIVSLDLDKWLFSGRYSTRCSKITYLLTLNFLSSMTLLMKCSSSR